MFGRILQLIAIAGFLLAASQSLLGQEGVAASAASAAAAPGAAAAPHTLWRFLGVPQGIQKIRDTLVNRRGNRPRLERRPPVKRIADPANLESDIPAIKKAAEIKQAEDLKLQKIKAIKYLATIGCGCYDKEGEITDALIAATDDCTPDVREAALEAIEDAANGECCRKCGSTSCCNEQISKRLSEIAYERDDSGCPIEPNADIRRLAARVLKRCCPGGPPTGPIEEEIPEEETSQVELIPAPDGEPDEGAEEDPIGEADDEEEAAIGEGSDDDQMDLEDAEDTLDSDSPDQLGDEDAEDVSLLQPSLDQPVQYRFEDARIDQPLQPMVPKQQLAPERQQRVSVPVSSVLATPTETTRSTPTEPAPKVSRLIRPSRAIGIHQVKPIVVKAPQRQDTSGNQPLAGLQPVAVTTVKPERLAQPSGTWNSQPDRSQVIRMPEVVPVAMEQSDNSVELRFEPKSELPTAAQPAQPAAFKADQPARSVLIQADSKTLPQSGLVARVIAVNLNSGHVILQGSGTRSLKRKMSGELYRPTADGPIKLSQVVVVRVESDSVRVRLTDRKLLKDVQLGDLAIFR